jgi:prepilin-type N-terminal cleavage/methylation domain-containing protein
MLTKKNNMRRGERGMTMIELLIAMVVLAAGLAAVMVLVNGAITSNARNKFDTTATTLSETVLERIAAAGPSATGTVTITDCANNLLTLNTAGAASPGAGATVNAAGNISFSGSAPTGYGISYVACAKNNSQATYDIRWNIVSHTSGSAVYSKTITVSARESAAGSLGSLFAAPVTLRTTITN